MNRRRPARRASTLVIATGVAIALAATLFLVRGRQVLRPTAPAVSSPSVEHLVSTDESSASGAPAALRRPADVAGARRVDVLVVEHGTLTPIENATVLYLPAGWSWESTSPESRRLSRIDHEAFLAAAGASTRTNASGRCAVETADGALRVAARHGARYGETEVLPDARGVQRIVLQPDRTLEALVVDATGTPVTDVELALQWRDARSSAHDPVPLGRTDASGRRRVAHCQRLVTTAGETLGEIVALVGADPLAGVVVDVTDPPPEVRLVLATLGRVVVSVRDRSGQPARGDGTDSVAMTILDERPTGTIRTRGSRLERVGADGTARFDLVPFDRFLVLLLEGHDADAHLDGPTRENPEVVVALDRDAAGATLVARLVDDAGQPLATKALLDCQYAEHLRTDAVSSDADGRITAHVGRAPVGRHAFVRIRASSPHPLGAELPAVLATAGINDLGDVALRPRQVLVRGRITAAEPKALRAARVEVERLRVGAWIEDPALRADVRPDDGAFEIVGWVPRGERLRLRAHGLEVPPADPVECSVPANDVEIAVGAAGTVTARLMLDADVMAWELQHRLQRTDRESADAIAATRMRPGADGVQLVIWAGLAPGTYRLLVAAAGGETLTALAGLTVTSGPCTDPRLARIDLRGRVRRIRVFVQDAAGAPLPDARGSIVSVGAERSDPFDLHAGQVAVSSARPLHLLVAVDAHRIVELPHVTGDATVRVVPTPVQLVRVMSELPFPDDVSVSLQLVPTGLPAHARQHLSEHIALARDGAGRFRLRRADRYAVHLHVGRGRRSEVVHGVTPAVIALDPDHPPDELTFEIEPAALRRALDALRR